MAAPVRIIFLGGLGEIGRNCMVVEQDDRLLLIDCGLMFPDADMHGIDLVLPDFTWLRENADRIEASVLFSEESCSFSQKDLLANLQMWADKARLRLSSPSAGQT